VPSAETTNKEAERLFRETLASDPSFVEARVRLGRLLDARGAHAEAAAELRAALAQNPPREVAFYGHLFAARAAQSLGHNEDAAAHYEAASTLYPDAQSARLGASQLALLKADVAGTLASVERLGPASAREAADPWWTYALASGRDVNELMERLWTAVRR
jgi:tetratricopeptide (TPR) repeat protein